METTDKQNRFVEFNNWLETFKKRNSGFLPVDIKIWWDRAEENKKKIRDLIKGVSIQRFYKVKASQQPLSEENINLFAEEIKKYAPSYFSAYKYNYDILAYPIIPDGNHKAIKTTKHIRSYVDLYLADRGFGASDRKEKLKDVDVLFSKLGAEWAKCKTSEIELEITLSTSPKGFALLGHYGPDEDSCWRQGSTSPYDKYLVGQAPETFIISISKTIETKKGKKQKNVARCIGFLYENTFNLANYYFSPGFKEGDGLAVIQMLLEEISGTSLKLTEGFVQICRIDGEKFQHNPYGNWSFYKNVINLRQRLNLDPNFVEFYICPTCESNRKANEHWETIDDKLACRQCMRSAHICEFSGLKTFRQLEPVMSENGEILYAHPKVAEQYKKCTSCNTRTVKWIVINDTEICQECLLAGWDECENCGKMTRNEELIHSDGDDYCKECVTEILI